MICLHLEWQSVGTAAKIIIRIAVYVEIIITGLAILLGLFILTRKVINVGLSFGRPKRALLTPVYIFDAPKSKFN